MAYATKEQMVARFGERELVQLTDRAADPSGLVDETVLAGAIADADAEIDSYIGSRYTLPLSSTPAVLTRFACDITRYLLWRAPVPDRITQSYERAIAWLRQVAKGEATLGLDEAGETTPASGGPEISASDRTFTGDTLADY